MSKVRVACFTVSLDGYAAGPDQDVHNPLGIGGTALHPWLIGTRTFQKTLFGADGGSTGVDDDFAAAGFATWARGSWAATCSAGAWPLG